MLARLLVLPIAVLAVLAASSAASAGTGDPNEKTTVTDIQYRISYSQEIPGNCAILAFSQWEASRFKGWEAVSVSVQVATSTTPRTDTHPVSPAPKYDDELEYGGNVVAPPNGSHWVLIGDGSFRAGPPPAEAECQAMLARVQSAVPDHKVTTKFRRTSVCATKFDRLTSAQKAAKKAKGKKAKAKAKKTLSKARKAFDKDCSK